jgi:hypothetical protein
MSSSLARSHFPEEDEMGDGPAQHLSVAPQRYAAPKTAAVDGMNNRFTQQQQVAQPAMAGGLPFSPAFGGSPQAQAQAQAQAQIMQMQIQMEMMRLQALQAQQYQAQLNVQNGQRRMGFNPPATAGPMTTSFNVEQPPRRMASNQLRNLAAPAEEQQVPMTAALGGKFGGRFPGRLSDDEDSSSAPTRVISGGLTLGAMAANASPAATADKGPSKADGASTWRRGSVTVPARTISPSVKITPPPTERVSPPPALAAPKSRPSPLSFNLNAAAFVPAVALVNQNDAIAAEESTSSASDGSAHSSPITSEENMRPPPSPREEASKKLYEGLGIGRPIPSTSPVPVVGSAAQRVFSQAVRMPRGPPSGADELGPKNFATRIRRKAIGGLGALIESRERRDVMVEAYWEPSSDAERHWSSRLAWGRIYQPESTKSLQRLFTPYLFFFLFAC